MLNITFVAEECAEALVRPEEGTHDLRRQKDDEQIEAIDQSKCLDVFVPAMLERRGKPFFHGQYGEPCSLGCPVGATHRECKWKADRRVEEVACEAICLPSPASD